MLSLNKVLREQGQHLLANKRSAILYAVILAMLPYTVWLSAALVALVTLRRGWRDGGAFCVYAATACGAVSLFSMTPLMAFVNAISAFLPCYLAACTLRVTRSWRAVSSVFFLQVLVALLMLKIMVPDFAMAEFAYIQAILHQMQAEGALLALFNETSALHQVTIANYLLGLQAVGVGLSAIIPLMLARSVQSQLFYPGGFRREMVSFRADKLGLLVLGIVFIAARQQNEFAMCLLPVLMAYFLLAGFSLSLTILAKQRPLRSFFLLLTALILLPFVMLPVYIIFGSLDSLFNLRLYLPPDAGRTT